jgi:hypothetical protein
MESNYVFLMSVHNDIEAGNVIGILEMEEIKAEIRSRMMSTVTGDCGSIDVYVPVYDYEDARQIVEVELVRGDL